MGKLTIPGLIDVSKHIPSCCGNCKHNFWDEYGPHCRNPKNWVQDDFEIEEKVAPEMIDDDGDVEWTFVCDNHERGVPFS